MWEEGKEYEQNTHGKKYKYLKLNTDEQNVVFLL